jgi:AcrR family transcriptional regulator
MSKKKNRNTRGKIVTAAWDLFYRQGYENTTVEEIIEASGTSRGSFYHYFNGKDALLSSLSYLFDDKYETLMETLDTDQDAFSLLMYLNRELFDMIERTVSVDLLAQMYATQLTTRGEKHLLDRDRLYYRLLRQITQRGQERGELRADLPTSEMVKTYALCERALLYDWCICGGEYSLRDYSARMMPLFLAHLKSDEKISDSNLD